MSSIWLDNLKQLEPLWEQTFNILPVTATILPLVGLGDDGLPNAASFITRRHSTGLEAVFTWSEAPTAFDTKFDHETSWQGIVPVVSFNGTDEETDSPDAAGWSVDDSGDAGFSVGFWLNVTNTAAQRTLLGKWGAGGAREWLCTILTTDILRFQTIDESAAVSPFIDSNATIAQGSWIHVVCTYDGTGGATAANGMTMYQNGSAFASTATNEATYVAMENSTDLVTLGFNAGSNFFSGKMAGGPLGPWFATHTGANTPTAAQIKRLYHMGRAALQLS